jgi:tetratricopeptide (TPR) repeat protein
MTLCQSGFIAVFFSAMMNTTHDCYCAIAIAIDVPRAVLSLFLSKSQHYTAYPLLEPSRTTSTRMPSAATNWSSEGYDTDALGDDLTSILEIGGGSSKVPTAAAPDPASSTDASSTDKDQLEQEEDPLQESEQLKSQGNIAFVNQEWLEAVDRYTEAIAACPGPYTGADLVQQQHEWQEAENVRLRQELNDEDVRQRQKKQAENASKNKATSKTQSETPDANAPKEEQPKNKEEEKQKEPRREFSPAEPHPHATKLAVYHCNRAAAQLHLQQYESAVTDCSVAILLNPVYVKAYVRRSAAYEHTDRTDQALTDAKKALELSTPSPPLNIRQTVARLQKLEDARLEKLKAETMDKLKDLGNSILGNFGLSMDNFNAKQDPNTGSYSISFDQGK